jgi:hypothetical protein
MKTPLSPVALSGGRAVPLFSYYRYEISHNLGTNTRSPLSHEQVRSVREDFFMHGLRASSNWIRPCRSSSFNSSSGRQTHRLRSFQSQQQLGNLALFQAVRSQD